MIWFSDVDRGCSRCTRVTVGIFRVHDPFQRELCEMRSKSRCGLPSLSRWSCPRGEKDPSKRHKMNANVDPVATRHYSVLGERPASLSAITVCVRLAVLSRSLFRRNWRTSAPTSPLGSRRASGIFLRCCWAKQYLAHMLRYHVPVDDSIF